MIGPINAAFRTKQVLNVMSLCLPIPPDARKAALLNFRTQGKHTLSLKIHRSLKNPVTCLFCAKCYFDRHSYGLLLYSRATSLQLWAAAS